MDFVRYTLEESKYDVEECHTRGMTYEAPVKVDVRLTVYDVDPTTGSRSIRDIQEQQVYFGAIPLMTPEGTFIINGTERVVVSQLHRSPGAFFGNDDGSTSASGKLSFSARIIPYRGSWLDFEFDSKDMLCVRIDRRRKMYATILLRALGYSTKDLLSMFYETETISIDATGIYRPLERRFLLNQRADFDVLDPRTGDVLVREKRKYNAGAFRKMNEAGVTRVRMSFESLCERVSAEDYYDEETGELFLECNQQITPEIIDDLGKRGINEIRVLYFDDDGLNVGRQLSRTLAVDKCQSPEAARVEI